MDRRTFVGATAAAAASSSWRLPLLRSLLPRPRMSSLCTDFLPTDRAGPKLFRDCRRRVST